MEDIKSNNRDIQSENYKYVNPTLSGADFPIVTCNLIYAFNSSSIIPTDIFKEAKEAGFTVCTTSGIGTGVPLNTNLSNAFDGGVSLITYNQYFLQEPTSIDKFKKRSPAFKGLNFSDEPTYNQLNGEVLYDEKLTFIQAYDFVKNQDPDFLVYINLIGSPEKDWMEGTTASTSQEQYYQYLEIYQKNFRPSFFCYDTYPISETANLLYIGIRPDGSLNGNEEGEVTVNTDHFYSNLQLYSEFSKMHDRPFWAFCQSRSFLKLTSINFKPIALEQYLRYEAFSALAYGAQGLFYWSYGTNPLGYNPDKTTGQKVPSEAYFPGLVDRRGKKTASWYYAQKVNREIHEFKSIFLGADFITEGCKNTYVLYDTHRLNVSLADEAELTLNKEKEDGDTTEDKNYKFIASQIRKGTDLYLMIVNGSALEHLKIVISFSFPSLIELTPVKSNGEKNTVLVKGFKHNRILPPGGYRLFKINK